MTGTPFTEAGEMDVRKNPIYKVAQKFSHDVLRLSMQNVGSAVRRKHYFDQIAAALLVSFYAATL